MAIQLVGRKAEGTGGGGSTWIVSLVDLSGGLDTAPSAGDVVFVAFAIASGGFGNNNKNPAILTAGYTTAADLYANDIFDTNLLVAYKRMGATPDTEVSVGSNSDGNAGRAVVVWVERGLDEATPLDVTTTTATSNNSGLPDPPAITPTTSGAKIIAFGAAPISSSNSFTAPADLDDFIQALGVDTETIAVGAGAYDWVSGEFDPEQWARGSSESDAFLSRAAATVALRPAAAGPTVESGTGTAAGTSTASGAGASAAEGVGDSAAASTGDAVGTSIAGSAGTSGGSTAASGVGAAGVIAATIGASSGASTGNAVASSVVASLAASSGASAATAAGASTAASTGASAGSSTASAVGSSTLTITLDSLVTGAPDLTTTTLTQTHSVVAVEILGQLPTLATSALTQNQGLLAEGVLTAQPQVGSPQAQTGGTFTGISISTSNPTILSGGLTLRSYSPTAFSNTRVNRIPADLRRSVSVSSVPKRSVFVPSETLFERSVNES